MALPALHRFERDGRRYVVDPDTCFCFECDAISWEVLELYPHTPVNHIYHLLRERHALKELQEVVSELEWLRASKSILLPAHDHSKDLQVERGLCALSVDLTAVETIGVQRRRWGRAQAGPSGWDLNIARQAAAFLLARSQQQNDLLIEFRLRQVPPDAAALAEVIEAAQKLGRSSGKSLKVMLHLLDLELKELPEALAGHTLSLRLGIDPGAAAATCGRLHGWWGQRFSQAAKRAAAWEGEEPVEAVLQVRRPQFAGMVRALDMAGFKAVRLETETLWTTGRTETAAAVDHLYLTSMQENAAYYAQRLLEHHYLRVEPLAGLFLRIHNGVPRLREDPSGTQALAVDAAGQVYPSPTFVGKSGFALGSLRTGELDETALRAYEDIGALTTPGCVNCWARSLCGGGSIAVHHALSGSIRRPDPDWCNSERDWLESAIAAFNTLAAAGLNFARLHQNLRPAKRPSLFALARAAYRMQLGVRPPEESDAVWLRRWENWNDAAYFTCTETSVLMATQYDREMDALHPRGIDRELVLLRRDGQPMGLLRLRPEHLEGTARMWLYFRQESDYAVEAHRRSFEHILSEAGSQQAFRLVLCPLGPKEKALAEFLEAIGFCLMGTEREALYLHRAYHDVQVFGYRFK